MKDRLVWKLERDRRSDCSHEWVPSAGFPKQGIDPRDYYECSKCGLRKSMPKSVCEDWPRCTQTADCEGRIDPDTLRCNLCDKSVVLDNNQPPRMIPTDGSLLCAYCLLSKRSWPWNAVTIRHGNAVCYEHLGE